LSARARDALLALAARCDRHLLPLLGDPPSEFASASAPLATLYEACAYSLANGGKRIRPMLVYAAATALGGGDSPALDHAACAVEMLHSYSLVHDDLPAMDNDDWRRGKPTCHKAFGEAVAILVGDALQARAFELLAQAPGIEDSERVRLVQVLAAAAGPRGMAGGQLIDLEATGKRVAIAALQDLHALKTGALIRAAVTMGAICAGASPAHRDLLDRYASAIGLAFQIQDDILDVTGDGSMLGKTQGKDAAANKSTYVSLVGLDEARQWTQVLLAEAETALCAFGERAVLLRDIARYVIDRQA
jgi:geranylgeranyl pyrophosphate synthase